MSGDQKTAPLKLMLMCAVLAGPINELKDRALELPRCKAVDQMSFPNENKDPYF